jgi:uncharacterized protein
LRKSRSPKTGLDIVYQRQHGAIVALRVAGHAGFAALGQDIVCAAASALVLSAAHGLRAYGKVSPSISDTPSQYRVDVPDGGNALAQAILETTVSGLESVAASYPGYLRVSQAKLGTRRRSLTGRRPRGAKAKASPPR